MGEDAYNAESLKKIIKEWEGYRDFDKTGVFGLFYIDDNYFGKVPMRLFIPKSYKKDIKTPCILLLHGAVQMSSFELAENWLANDSANTSNGTGDPILNYFRNLNNIILYPIADPQKRFDWVVNRFRGKDCDNDTEINLTYNCLVQAVIQVKRYLNVDDSKVYAFGHSDGADGAFCLGVFQPSIFAAFILYNSFLNSIDANNIFLKNVSNRPFYIVHSDLDDLRPIEQTSEVIRLINQFKSRIIYKEYHSYYHFDKHITLDLPTANLFMLKHIRNPFLAELYFESNNSVDNRCDWITIKTFDLSLPKSQWHTDKNVNTFNKRTKEWLPISYYDISTSFALKANYYQNCFNIYSSRITEFEILISDEMVDLSKPVTVILNGREIVKKYIRANKKFMLRSFETNFDRQAIWQNSIKVSVPIE